MKSIPNFSRRSARLSELEARCRRESFRYASNVDAQEAAYRRYDYCIDVIGARTHIEYTGSSSSIKKQDSSNEDIILSYFVRTQNDSEWNTFSFFIQTDGDFIILYLVGGNGCILPYGLSEMISDIVQEHDENFLNLKHYEF
jgi:hypothetical protein